MSDTTRKIDSLKREDESRRQREEEEKRKNQMQAASEMQALSVRGRELLARLGVISEMEVTARELPGGKFMWKADSSFLCFSWLGYHSVQYSHGIVDINDCYLKLKWNFVFEDYYYVEVFSPGDGTIRVNDAICQTRDEFINAFAQAIIHPRGAAHDSPGFTDSR